MANMVMKMAKKSPKFLSVIPLALLLFLNGCSAAPSIKAEDAEEVVLDDAGFSKQDVDDLSTEETADGFRVEFNTNKAQFIYSVSEKGIVENREVIRKEESERTDTPTKNDDGEEKTEEPDSEDNQTQEAELIAPDSETSEQEQRAINLALANAGLTRDNVTDIHVTREDNLLVIRFRYGDYINVCRVDPHEERVISTLFE